MPRPTLIVATIDSAMAYALETRLSEACLRLGLKLEVCPEGDSDEQEFSGKKIRAYRSAEALFDVLEKREPIELADTLIVLDVGTQFEDAFRPAATANEQGWYATSARRAGVAVELIVRFPQVFPVIFSPTVSLPEAVDRKDEVIHPEPRPTSDTKWRTFHGLRKKLQSAHREVSTESVSCADFLLALTEPLHFVSPLDGGCGLYSTLARFARGMRCWFDPTGLRTLVKNCFLGTLFGSETDWTNTWFVDQREKTGKGPRQFLLDRLTHVAIAVDEERAFAMLNAYTAYKFGRRAWIVTTFAEFDAKPLWIAQAGTSADGEQAQRLDTVVIRDIDLRFPDLPVDDSREQLKSIYSRIWQLSSDGEARLGDGWSVRAVSSHPKVVERFGPYWFSDHRRIGELSGQYYGLSKPIGSLYELELFLERANAEGSVASNLSAVSDESKGGHGAPYLNLAMAESLLQQARRCKESPVENLLGALLAGEAYELLLGMSKTTALEALLVIHKKEVAAEAEFPGVAYDIYIGARKKDIEATLDKLTRNAGRTRSSMQNSFLSQFWAELRIVYREGEQFAAAEAANVESLVHTRWVFRKLVTGGSELGRFVRWPRRWLVMAATTFAGWVCAAALISFGFASWYGYLEGCRLEWSQDGMWHYLNLVEETLLTSLGLGLTDNLKKIVDCAEHLGNVAAISHLGFSYLLFGVLVSMLYRKVTRG